MDQLADTPGVDGGRADLVQHAAANYTPRSAGETERMRIRKP